MRYQRPNSVYMNTGPEIINVDGMLVEKDALLIAEKIQDYDPDLVLITADPDDPNVSFTSAPFMILRDKGNGVYDKIMEFWELDDRVLEKLWAADSYRNDPLALLVKKEEERKREIEKKNAEKKEERVGLGTSILRNPKSSYTFKNEEGTLVKINDDRPIERDKERTYL